MRDELESLAFLRLMGPLDLALQARYEALSTQEHDLLQSDDGTGLAGKSDGLERPTGRKHRVFRFFVYDPEGKPDNHPEM